MIDQPLENNIPDENSVDPCLVSLQMRLDMANSKISELEKERGELNIQIEVLKHSDAENYELYAELLFSPNEPPVNLQAHNLEQTRKGFWLGFEDARCHPDEMNILKQWEGTRVFSEAIKDGE